MKEKRIDIHLSIASLLHSGISGSIGVFAIEFFSERARMHIIVASLAAGIILLFITVFVYYLAHKKTRKKR